MGIEIQQVRVHGLRGLVNLQIDLNSTTVLMGMNNAGKTTFLKALQIALGSSQFITKEDFNVSNGKSAGKIIVDVKIIPTDNEGNRCSEFGEEWELLFKEDRIMFDDDGDSSVPFRTVVTYDPISAGYKTRQFALQEWPMFEDNGKPWYTFDTGNEKGYRFEEIPFFYIDAQRDILEDLRTKTSFLGRLISKIEYNEKDLKAIEKQIQELNERAVNSSDILSTIRDSLKELDSAMDSKGESVEITPFAKKVRDLNKSVTIAYGENDESFTMEYHGMGTRSWSSLLTLKSFINLRRKNAEAEHTPFYPVLAIEEPEAHLHPNAQKKLFNQISQIQGQKLISTHSPYVVSCAHVSILRNFYKKDSSVCCGAIDTSTIAPEDIRKIERQVMNTRAEMFFSKVIVLSEGETEEQVLPIIGSHYFSTNTCGTGIEFIGVSGFGGYLPFLRVAEAFNIPWFILSDGEKEATDKVAKDVGTLFGKTIDLSKVNNVVTLDGEADFEGYLINAGYIDEIKNAIANLNENPGYLENLRRKKHGSQSRSVRTDKKCNTCKQFIYNGETHNYDGDEGLKKCIYDYITSVKTKIAPKIAEELIKGEKPLPPKIILLFDLVKSAFNGGVDNAKK